MTKQELKCYNSIAIINTDMEEKMKISELFKNNKCVFSFEVFPPKKDTSADSIYKTLDSLKALSPDFISVT